MIKATAYAGTLLALSLASIPATAQVQDYEVITAPAMIAPEATSAVLTEITLAGDRQIAVGDYGLVISRDSADVEWQQALVDTSVFLTAVDFADDLKGWAVGHHGVIMHTSDGGRTWQRQLDGFQYIELQQLYFAAQVERLTEALDNDELSEDERYELELELETAEFQLENAEFAVQEGPTKPFLDVLVLSEQVILVSGAYGSLLRSIDGGVTWNLLDAAVENPDNFHLNALEGGEEFTFLAGEAGQLFRSNDQGTSWETLESPYYGSYFGLHIDAKDRLWVFGLRGNIFVSDDQGNSFRQIKLEDPVNINAAADAPNGGVYLVGNAGALAWVNAAGEIIETRHGSGAALTDLVINNDQSLTLVGQLGVLTLPAFAQ
ncbi:YCF48-related protein [Pseudidiomarina salinarum]|uniref:YCF48-related protein n=1 Tax=Pseudidiomarina salinarum TaxID=435908 RepID=UPI000690A7B2|nr:YCF48-related protein [Pseudidiomarina salinarum]